MDLQAARELKARLTADVLTASAEGAAIREYAAGIAPRGDGQFAVAIRVTDEVPADGPLAQLAAEAGGDVDVRVVGVIRPLTAPDITDLQSRQRPLYPGVSVAHPDVTAGTLGGFVTVDGVRHLLSNSHVLANSGQAAVGDDSLQPGPADGGDPAADVVATLAAFAPLVKDVPNLVDAAISVLAEGIDSDPAGYPGGALGPVTDQPPADGAVQKVGRTTGLTSGRVTAFEVDGITVQYDVGVLSFDNQIEIEGDGDLPFSEGGDSGSVIWTTTDRAPFGLLFAGSTQGGSNGRGLTYANPLTVVLAELGAAFDTGEAEAPPTDPAPTEPTDPAPPTEPTDPDESERAA